MANELSLGAAVLACAILCGCKAQASAAVTERKPTMSTATVDENKQIVRRLFEDAFNHNQPDLIDQLVASEYVDATGERGPGAFKQVLARLHGSFPDIHYMLEDVIAEGNQVAIRWHWSGTHRGSYRGVAPTLRSLTNSGAATFRVEAGKIVAAALETDRLGFLQAIGVVAPTDTLFKPRTAEVNPAPPTH